MKAAAIVVVRNPQAPQDSPEIINSWQVMGETFELDARYKIIDYLGAGAYGVVCAAEDDSLKIIVAIKKCKRVFHSKTLAKRTLRELRLLRLLNHDNIVKIKSVLKPRNTTEFQEVYVIFELMETDLAQIIRSPQRLFNEHIQYFLFQITLGLRYLHNLGILHRDLKPRNLLVNEDCSLKIADFGLARLYNERNASSVVPMTEYVTTRWYRAPEIIVGWPKYTSAVDMWAVGCILGELLGKAPMFPGPDSPKQLELIATAIGVPPAKFIEQVRKPNYKKFLTEFEKPAYSSSFNDKYPTADPQAIDLLSKLLVWEPSERLTAIETLNHPYLRSLSKLWEKEKKVSLGLPSNVITQTANMFLSLYEEQKSAATPCFDSSPSHNIIKTEFEYEDHGIITLETLRQEFINEFDCYDNSFGGKGVLKSRYRSIIIDLANKQNGGSMKATAEAVTFTNSSQAEGPSLPPLSEEKACDSNNSNNNSNSNSNKYFSESTRVLRTHVLPTCESSTSTKRCVIM